MMDRYIALWQGLATAKLDTLDQLVTPEFRFQDPFHDITGIPAFRRMLERTLDRLDEVRFDVLDQAHGTAGWYLRWRFTARFRGQPMVIEGMSEIHLSVDGRISQHIDHWDASRQVYQGVPVLGWLIRLARRLAA